MSSGCIEYPPHSFDLQVLRIFLYSSKHRPPYTEEELLSVYGFDSARIISGLRASINKFKEFGLLHVADAALRRRMHDNMSRSDVIYLGMRVRLSEPEPCPQDGALVVCETADGMAAKACAYINDYSRGEFGWTIGAGVGDGETNIRHLRSYGTSMTVAYSGIYRSLYRACVDVGPAEMKKLECAEPVGLIQDHWWREPKQGFCACAFYAASQRGLKQLR